MAKPARKPRAKKRGGIGQEIFDQVEKMVGEMKIPRLQAFKKLSEKTGRRVGTVAANYYRLARQKGVPLRRKAGRRRGRPAGVAAAAAGGTSGGSASIRRALSALQEIGNVLRKQEAELASMRRQQDSISAIRRLVGKG
jgi:hypothetical protein